MPPLMDILLADHRASAPFCAGHVDLLPNDEGDANF